MNHEARAIIDGVSCASVPRLAAAIKGVDKRDRMSALLFAAGVQFFDSEHRFVCTPAVSLAGIGGLLLNWTTDAHPPTLAFDGLPSSFGIDVLRRAIKEGFGASGLMTYLNPRDRELHDLANHILSVGHRSVEHFVTLNILFAGASTGTEVELACQRDLLHLSRITVARTSTQVRPCIYVPGAAAYDVYRNVTDAIDASLLTADFAVDDSDELEARNELYPIAKATAVLASGTVRNFRKIAAIGDDEGKEAGYRVCLRQLGQLLEALLGD